jgi:Domain of unknown function (DUF4338)/DDE_Tnp_1-associated/Transposase DDE domain
MGMPKQEKAPEAQILRRIIVRLVLPEERDRFDQLLEQQHYLHSARLGGQCLRYVAELDGEWVALICFSAPALNIKARERWIRWTPRQRARRLCLVVNNSRFLVVLQREGYPNLASCVLSLCLKRLKADWQEHWGHPVLLVESFVDESKYRGTCYRACGFAAVGCSSGYGRSSRDFYVEHGQAKQLYLRELRPGAAALLRRGRLPAELADHEESISGPCPLRAPTLLSLLEVFRTLGDRRRGHGLRHRQPFVLACAAVAMLMGAGGYQAFEDLCSKLTQRQLKALGCRFDDKRNCYVAPSDSTFFRVLNGLDAGAFDLAMGRWMMEQEISVLECLAVDGKVLRGSGRSDGKALQLLSAVSHRLRLTVAQEPIQEKSNEIPALKPLLKKLPLQKTLITADALHCQQESARFVTQDLGSDYLFGLKGNQSGILERAQSRLPQSFFSL